MTEKTNYWARLPESTVLQSISKTYQLLFSPDQYPECDQYHSKFSNLALIDPQGIWIDSWFASSFGRRLSSLTLPPLLPHILTDFIISIENLLLREEASFGNSEKIKVSICSHYIIFLSRLLATTSGSKLFPVTLISNRNFKMTWLFKTGISLSYRNAIVPKANLHFRK
jgi:hypothetical protein